MIEFLAKSLRPEIFWTAIAAITLGQTNPKLTVVVDKGMNSEPNMQTIDQRQGLEFITTYSPAFAEDLIRKDLSFFTPVDTPKNRELAAKDQEDDQMVAWRTTGQYWGGLRTVVVTFNPRTAAKQRYNFEKKLRRLQNGLFEIRSIIVTSHHDLSTDDIVKASLDRYQVENSFRQTKAGEFGNFRPMWSRGTRETDSKIRCHIFSCIVALTYLRLLTLWLNRAGIKCTPDSAMQSMRNLASCLCWHSGKRKPTRMLEKPDPEQAAILAALGHQVANGVLQVMLP